MIRMKSLTILACCWFIALTSALHWPWGYYSGGGGSSSGYNSGGSSGGYNGGDGSYGRSNSGGHSGGYTAAGGSSSYISTGANNGPQNCKKFSRGETTASCPRGYRVSWCECSRGCKNWSFVDRMTCRCFCHKWETAIATCCKV